MHDTPETQGVIRKLWIGETDRFREHLAKVRTTISPNAIHDGWGDVAPVDP